MAETLTHINPMHLDSVWPRIEAMVVSSLDRAECEYFTADQLRLQILRRECDLVLLHDDDEVIGLATVEYINFPQRRVAMITHLAGNLLVGQERFESFKAWCRGLGASEIMGWCDEPRARLYAKFGMQPYRQVMRCPL